MSDEKDEALAAIAAGAFAWDDAMDAETAPGEVPYLNVWIYDHLAAAGFSIVRTSASRLGEDAEK